MPNEDAPPQWFCRFQELYVKHRAIDRAENAERWDRLERIERNQETLATKQVLQADEIEVLKTNGGRLPCGRCACCLARDRPGEIPEPPEEES